MEGKDVSEGSCRKLKKMGAAEMTWKLMLPTILADDLIESQQFTRHVKSC